MKLILLTFLFPLLSFAQSLEELPVQDGGRVKPYDTFAREMLQLVYGKQVYKSEESGVKRPATEIVMTWLLQPQAWEGTPLFEVRHGELKKALKLDGSKKHFSMNEITSSDRLSLVFQELASQREAKVKLDPYFQAVQRLESQIITFREIGAGRMLRVAPPREGETWISVAELPETLQLRFLDITKAFVETLGVVTGKASSDSSVNAQAGLNQAVKDFQALARQENPALYDLGKRMQTEVRFNRFHPFQWAWIVYLLAGLCGILIWVTNKQVFYKPLWVLTAIGFLLHLYGFGLRIYLTGRPPVSNMYETVIWVGFGTVLFAAIFEAIYKWRFILTAGALVGFLCLALGDMAPAVLDPSLQPLEPVLRDNFWLLVHVLTITISYAAFFLAFALGDIGLFYFIKDERVHQDKIRALVLAIYRSLQVGVAFLAPGIILGGVWADYSWGRFWGWDPKETWALIALLGYLAVLHARMMGMIKDFGMIVSAIVTFSLVIMAWYGVNFVLGAGLHSYGFGAGGVEYVSGFVAIHLLAVIFVAIVRHGRK